MFSSRHHVSTVITLATLTLGVAITGCSVAHRTATPATSQVPGANPVAWVDVYCAGLADAVAAQAQATMMPPTPQGHKDALLMAADTAQHAFTNAAHQLTQLGPPAITDGTRAQNTMVSFFTTAAAAIGDRRAKLAALDANDPHFAEKVDQQPAGPVLSAAATQTQELTSNKELASALNAAPQCQRLRNTATH